MNVLFCDIDGVLNCKRDYQVVVTNGLVFNQEKCAMLLKGIKDLDVTIVLSSTWRKSQESVDFLSNFLPIKARTPILGKERGYEIKQWLDEHKYENYAILDDDSDMLPEQLPHLVQTTFETGLTESHVHRVRWLLTKGPRGIQDSKKPA